MGYTNEQIFLQRIFKFFMWLFELAYGCKPPINTGEIKLMPNYIVKDNNPDVGFQLAVGEVKDEEGNVITDPQGLTTEIVSTDDTVLAFTPGADDRSGSVRFGSPGQASLQYSVKGPNGIVLGSGSDGFTVTTGDPASISGVTASFDGLTPVDETGGEG